MPGRSESLPAVFDFRVVGKAANTPNTSDTPAAAESETADDRERHLIAAVGKYRFALPLVAFQHVERARELHDTV
jgi:hypothetical protein